MCIRDSLEGARPVGCAVAGRAVVAAYASAEVTAAARSVAATLHVEQRSGVGVGKRGRDAGGFAGEGIDGADDRGGDAGAPEDVPVRAAVAAVAVVDRDPGGRVGDCRDISHGALGAGVGGDLPAGPGDVGRAAASGTAPDGLAESGAVGGVERQGGAADRGDGVERCRYLDAVTTVAGADGDRYSGVAV